MRDELQQLVVHRAIPWLPDCADPKTELDDSLCMVAPCKLAVNSAVCASVSQALVARDAASITCASCRYNRMAITSQMNLLLGVKQDLQ